MSLEVNQRKCEETPESARPDATNLGPIGLKRQVEVWRREGDVLCHVDTVGDQREVETVKYPGDEETHLDVLNVSCAVYPYDVTSEDEQVGQVADALRELVRQTS